jgi:hypothetical protein
MNPAARPAIAAMKLLSLVPLFVLATLSSPSTVLGQATESRRGPARLVDDSDRVVMEGSVHPLARAQADRGRTDANLPMERIVLSLALRPGAQQELDQLLADQQDSSSPSFHRWLTPEEFGARFGASDEDIRAVTDWLGAQGFLID